ncbi:MAG: L7Ae/L30e/S12e/Gadd45 family ribosomal protein [Turicibacter sp.]
MNRNWLNFLGIASSASAVITGEQLVVSAIQSRKVYLVIIAEDIGENTYKRVTDKCKFYNINCIQIAKSEELGHALGKDFRKVVGITNPNFAKALKNKINA